MTTQGKCRAQGGFENCHRPDCPERRAFETSYDVPASFGAARFPKAAPLPVLGAWTEKDTELFKTIHGSKLYGLSHKGSDDDFYVITPTRRVARAINAKQKIDGKNDTTSMDFASFISLSQRGVPQALEAMFSKKAESPYFEEYRQGYFASDPVVIHTYMRTIKSFSLSTKDPFKRKRHAMRIALNLEELIYTGRFNPTLSKINAMKITRLAEKEGDDYIKELKSISPIEVDWTFADRKQ